MTVTIIPPTCGREIFRTGPRCGDQIEGHPHTYRCHLCHPLGIALMDAGFTYFTDARDAETQWSRACTILAWNITLAAIATSAADQALAQAHGFYEELAKDPLFQFVKSHVKLPCGCHCQGGCGDPYAACMWPCKDHIPF